MKKVDASMPEKEKKDQDYYYRLASGVLLTILATVMFLIVWYYFVEDHNQTEHLLGYGNLGMAAIAYTALYYYIGTRHHVFELGIERLSASVPSQVICLLLVDGIEVFVSMAITGEFRFFGQFVVLYFILFIAQTIVLCLTLYALVHYYRKIFPPIQLLEIHGDHRNNLCLRVNEVHFNYHIADSVYYKDLDIKQALQKYEAILLNDIPAIDKNQILKECFACDKPVYFVPKISDIIIKTSKELYQLDTPLYVCRNTTMSRIESLIKRTFDFVSSGLALIVLSPVFAVVSLAIKLEDGGPVFFRQERCTIGGKRFMIIKFRSMIVDAEKDGRPHPAGQKDDRITKVGRVIRATRIDELPQLINILKGEMSIVGPRPERVEHVEKYSSDIPEFVLRYKMKGGLTGYAQVYGKYNTTALDKLKMDLLYIMNFSLRLDIQIIFETLKTFVMKDRTEGFSDKRAVEMHDAGLPKEDKNKMNLDL